MAANLERSVDLFDGFTLNLYRGPGRHYLKAQVEYEIVDGDGETVFDGDDIHMSPLAGAIGSTDSVVQIADWLSIRPGEADDEMFEDFSEERLDWLEKYGGRLREWADERRFMADEESIYEYEIMSFLAAAILAEDGEASDAWQELDPGEAETLRDFLNAHGDGDWVMGFYDMHSMTFVYTDEDYLGRCDILDEKGSVCQMLFIERWR